MTTAIVLSGGGSRGDFQVGALRYLYDSGVRPDILTGCSVGAINAVKLAEGEDPGDPSRGLPGLESIWASLNTNADMYVPEEWLFDPKMAPEVRNLLTGLSRKPPDGPQHTNELSWGDILGPIINFGVDVVWLNTEGADLLNSISVIASRARALYNLHPIRVKLNADLDVTKINEWASTGGRLRLGTVALESGRLRYVTESGSVVERDGATYINESVPVPGHCTAQEESVQGLEATLADLQDQLVAAAPNEKSGFARKIRTVNGQLDTARKAFAACRDAAPRQPLSVSLRDGVLASASIPGIFPPMPLGNETYVDGGIREVLPLQVAVSLGADTIYAVEASAPEMLPSTVDFRTAGVADIVARGLTEITIDEINRDDRRPESVAPSTTHFIRPERDFHDILTIDPGLVQIARDYGWMRAADSVAQPAASAERAHSATAITAARRDIWAAENRRWGQPDPEHPTLTPPPPADPALQADIDTRKAALQVLIDQRLALAGPVPAGLPLWVGRMELHPWLGALNQATFVAQVPPADGLTSGTQTQVSVTMRNTGTTTWTPADSYALGSQAPQDNITWGLGRVGLPGPVAPGQEVTFAWTATVPAPITAKFGWQMVQDGVEWFGDSTPVIDISIAEPAQCQMIRSDIAERKVFINDERTLIDGLDPKNALDRKEIREHTKNVKDAVDAIKAAQNRAAALGCGPV